MIQPSDQELIRRFRQGDGQAELALYERYKPIVRGKSRSYYLAGADREDLVQEGMIGLYKALRDYDPEKGQSFRSFADMCVTRQILSAVKTAARKKHQPLNSYVSLTRPAYGEEESDRTLSDLVSQSRISDPEELLIGSEDRKILERCIRTELSPLEKKTLHLYLAGLTYTQIAAGLGRDEKAVDNAMQRIKHKLDKKMKAYAIKR